MFTRIKALFGSQRVKTQVVRAVRIFGTAFGPAIVAYLAGGNAITVAGVGAACASALEVTLRAFRPTVPVAKPSV